MDLREKRKAETQSLKEKRREDVILAAIDVFKNNGIDNTKMTDIAEKAEIGVATIYRYFKTKPDLVVEAGTYLWKNQIGCLYKNFYDSSFTKLNGADSLRKVLNIFINIYKEYPEILSLLEHFDNYIIKEGIPISRLNDYEKSIFDMKYIIFDAIKQGRRDGSIKKDIDINIFYITISHTLISLSQKLILRGTILESDSQVPGLKQLELIVEMAMNYISI